MSDNESSSSSDLEIVTGAVKEQEESKKPQEQQNIDINAIPIYDGKQLIDVDLEEFTDKPWLKPGTDISDYFNYGFNEDTWKQYCEKQRQLRQEYSIQMQFDRTRDSGHRPVKNNRYDDPKRKPYSRNDYRR
eukprot:NODE_10_length_61504_cov_0.956502.p49 type:complete len:132 gc:universal NODE_10_length_61504_cov_0.956502:54782-55177(+)